MMIKCKICGCEFPPVIDKHYVARDNGRFGLVVTFQSNDEEKLYDAFDCPFCGCQTIAQERKRDYMTNETTEYVNEIKIKEEGIEDEQIE